MTAAQKRWFLPLATLMLMAGILLGRTAHAWYLPGAALLTAAGAACMLKGRARFAAILAAVCCVGCGLGFFAYHPVLPETGVHTVRGVVAEEVRDGARNQHKTVLRSATIDGKVFSDGIYWSFYSNEMPEGVTPGAWVELQARTYAPSGADNPGGYDFREALLQKGVTLGAYGMDALTVTDGPFTLWGWSAGLRARLISALKRTMGDEAGGYAAAMLLGTGSLVPDEDRTAFNRMGIAHILSVSGYHVGVLTMLLLGLMKGLRLPRRARLPLLAAVLGTYAMLTGLHAPVVRAALLVLLAEYGWLRHRQAVNLHLLCASACIQLAVSPAQLTGISFQLTYGALLGITLVSPRLAAQKRMSHGWRGKLRVMLGVGIGAQAGLLLPQLYWFHTLPVLGLLFNLAVLGLAQIVLALDWAALVLAAVPGVGEAAGWAAAQVTGWMLKGVRMIGSQAWLTLWTRQANLVTALGCALLLAGLNFLWRAGRKRRMAVALTGILLLTCSVIPWPEQGAEYIQLSVGNADAAVLRDRDAVWVIDTGEDGQALATFLHQRRWAVEGLVLTHLHSDHAAGVQALLDDGIPVKRCYVPAGALACRTDEGMAGLLDALAEAGAEVNEVSRGDTLPLPDGALTVLWPEGDHVRPGRDANLYSMALLAQVRGTTLLLAGDLDGEYESYAAHPADVLKAAHHGSASSTSAAFVEAVGPQAILVSGGDAERLADVSLRCGGRPVYGTQVHGAIRIQLEENGFVITGER